MFNETPVPQTLPPRTFQGTILALVFALAACGGSMESTDVQKAAAAPKFESSQQALFTNDSFESGDLTDWTLELPKNPSSGPQIPVLSETDLRLAASGSTARTYVRPAGGDPTRSSIPPGLTAGDSVRYPRYGNYAAIVNELGSSNNANRLKQTTTVTTEDVDPFDGKVHIRFVVLPVLQNPGHNLNEQPYYFVTIRNVTKNTTLVTRFNFSNESGVPWKTTSNASIVYTDWLLFDHAANTHEVAIGDQLEVRVIAAGCSQGGHWGYAIVDAFGSKLPGLAVYASAPDSVAAGADYQYLYRVINGGSATATGTQVTVNLPAGTTFRSVDTPGITCTRPSIGSSGAVICNMGAVAGGASTQLKITVRADPTASGEIKHGWYFVKSNEEQMLVGPLVRTAVTAAGAASYVDLYTSVNNGVSGLDWNQDVTYSVVVGNRGPSTATAATVVSNTPSNLTNVSWTCTPSAGAACGAASGTGFLNTTATLPAGTTATYTVVGKIITGSGVSSITFSATAGAPSGTTESNSGDNGSGDEDGINILTDLTVTKTGTGLGTVSSVPNGIACGDGCSTVTVRFATDSVVSLKAIPKTGSRFIGWSGACSGTSQNCNVTLSTLSTATAVFDAEPVSITSPLKVNAAIGKLFRYDITAFGSGTITFGEAGIPAWLTLDPATGIMTGTPPGPEGVGSFTITATNGTVDDSKTLEVTQGNAPVITSSLTFNLASSGTGWGTVNVGATGTSPLVYNASNLPGTVYYNSGTGVFAGSAGANGVFNVPVAATNAFGSDNKIITVSIGGAPTITSAATATGTTGAAFTYTLVATGTPTPTLSFGTLPSWLTRTGDVISGTPTQAGVYSIALGATNTGGTNSRTLTITIEGPAVITSGSTATGVVGQMFSYTLTAEGTAPVTTSIVSGLPSWATFDSGSGIISGIPTAEGSFPIGLNATNSAGSDSKTLTVTVSELPQITNSTLSVTAEVDVPFMYTVTATGTAPLALLATGLPSWANFNASTGVISGTPTNVGSYSIGLNATNAGGSANKTLTLLVESPPIFRNLTATCVVNRSCTYNFTLAGTEPMTLVADDAMPAGLSFGSRAITGTPTVAAVNNLRFTASNTLGTVQGTVVLTVRAAIPEPTVTSPLVTNDTTPTISGTLPTTEAGNKVDVYKGGTKLCEATVQSDGSWSCDSTVTLAEGDHALTIKTLDVNSGEQSENGTPVTLKVDTTVPGLPTNVSPADDTHVNTKRPTFTGEAEPGSTVNIKDGNGDLVCTTVTDSNGDWSCTPPAPGLAEGTHPLKVVVVDPANNPSAEFDLELHVDTEIPNVPTMQSPVPGASLATPPTRITVNAETGTTVVITINGSTVCTATASNGQAYCDLPSPALTDGDYTVTSTSTDAAGNVSPTLTTTFNVDTTTPSTPGLTGPTNGQELPTNRPTFTGTGTNGHTITVLVDGGPGCTAVVANGMWSCTQPTDLAAGPHTVTITATNPAGTTSSVGTTTLVVDTTSPVPPTVVTINDGKPTKDNTPRFEGEGEPGSTISVKVDGVEVCTATVASDGKWFCDASSPLSDGTHAVTITSKDPAGNESSVTSTTAKIDTTVPAAPVVSSPVAGAPGTSGTLIPTDKPTFQGTAEPGSVVQVIIDNAVACSTTADSSGAWSCTVTAPLSIGTHTVSFSVTDVAGNTTTSTPGTIDVQTASGGFEMPKPVPGTGKDPGGKLTSTSTNNSSISGSATPGSKVNVYVDGVLVKTVTADENGLWTAELPVMAAGTHKVEVGITDADGREVYRSEAQNWTVENPDISFGGGLGCSSAGGSASFVGLSVLALWLARRRTSVNGRRG